MRCLRQIDPASLLAKRTEKFAPTQRISEQNKSSAICRLADFQICSAATAPAFSPAEEETCQKLERFSRLLCLGARQGPARLLDNQQRLLDFWTLNKDTPTVFHTRLTPRKGSVMFRQNFFSKKCFVEGEKPILLNEDQNIKNP